MKNTSVQTFGDLLEVAGMVPAGVRGREAEELRSCSLAVEGVRAGFSVS